jgi:ribonuclease HI
MIIRTLDFYTDGAWSSKSEMGGWACICVEDNAILTSFSGKEPYSTNNRMELSGFLCALEQVDEIESRNVAVNIYVDSAYLCNCINDKWYQNWMSNGWRTADRQDVKNQDLWRRIIALYIKNANRLKEFNVIKVKSHKKKDESEQAKWNAYADLLAVKARKELEI